MENYLLEAKSELKTKQLFIQIMLKVIFYVWQWTTISIYINVSIFIKIKSKNISQNSFILFIILNHSWYNAKQLLTTKWVQGSKLN